MDHLCTCICVYTHYIFTYVFISIHVHILQIRVRNRPAFYTCSSLGLCVCVLGGYSRQAMSWRRGARHTTGHRSTIRQVGAEGQLQGCSGGLLPPAAPLAMCVSWRPGLRCSLHVKTAAAPLGGRVWCWHPGQRSWRPRLEASQPPIPAILSALKHLRAAGLALAACYRWGHSQKAEMPWTEETQPGEWEELERGLCRARSGGRRAGASRQGGQARPGWPRLAL